MNNNDINNNDFTFIGGAVPETSINNNLRQTRSEEYLFSAVEVSSNFRGSLSISDISEYMQNVPNTRESSIGDFIQTRELSLTGFDEQLPDYVRFEIESILNNNKCIVDAACFDIRTRLFEYLYSDPEHIETCFLGSFTTINLRKLIKNSMNVSDECEFINIHDQKNTENIKTQKDGSHLIGNAASLGAIIFMLESLLQGPLFYEDPMDNMHMEQFLMDIRSKRNVFVPELIIRIPIDFDFRTLALIIEQANALKTYMKLHRDAPFHKFLSVSHFLRDYAEGTKGALHYARYYLEDFGLPLDKISFAHIMGFLHLSGDHLVGVEPNPGPPVVSRISKSFQSKFSPQINLPVKFGLDEQTKDLLEDLIDTAQDMTKGMSNVKVDMGSSQVSEMAAYFKDRMSGIKNTHWYAVCATLGIFVLRRMYPESSHLFNLVNLGIQAYLLYDVESHGIASALLSFINLLEIRHTDVVASGDLEPQIDMSFDQKPILDSLVGLIYLLIYKKTPEENFTLKFLKSCSEVPKMKEGVEHLFDFVLTVVEKVCNYMLTQVGKEEITLKRSCFPELKKLADRVSDMCTALRNGAPYNYDNAMLIFEMEKEANNILAKIPNTKDFVEYKKQAMTVISSLKPLVSKMERNNIVGNGPRIEPVGIMLGGPSGVGKSTAIVPLILAVNAQVMPKEKLESFKNNHNDHIWNFIPENPFHDSYHGQFNTIVDEAGAQLDAAGTPDPGALGILRMINNANFPLHMAHLEDKGNVNFNSEMVWATTNRTFFDWKSMYLSEAYTRRFNISVLHVPAEKFCKPGTITSNLWDRRLDLSKVPVLEDGFDMSVNEFYRYDFNKGQVLEGPYDFQQLVDMIVNTYKAKRQSGEKLLKFHASIKEKYSKLRAQGGIEYEKLVKYVVDAYNFSEKLAETFLDQFNIKGLKDIRDNIGFFVANYFDEKPLLGQIKDFIADNIKYILGSLAIIKVIWYFIQSYFKPQSGDVRKPSNKPSRNVSKAGRVVRRSPGKLSKMLQVGINQNALDLAAKIMKKNMYAMTCRGAEKPFGFCLFLAGRTAVCPEHFIYYLDDMVDDEHAVTIEFRRCGSPEVGFDVDYDDISMFYVDGEDNDVVYLRFGDNVFPHSDITKFIPDSTVKQLDSKFYGALVRPLGNAYTLVSTEMYPIGCVDYGGYSTKSAISYPIATKWGECGAPIFMCEKGSSKPYIVGFHVAGDGSNGIATRIYRENVDFIVNDDGENSVEFDDKPICDEQMSNKFLIGEKVRKNVTPTKNQVIPSALHGAYGESNYAPSLLREKNGIDPWVSARKKYSCVQPDFNKDIMDAVTSHTIQEMHYNSIHDTPWKPRVFSFEEAVEGIDGVDYWDAIPRQTSAGYPFNLDVTKKGKKDWFGDDGPFDFTTEKAVDLKNLVQEHITKLSQGNRIKVLYADYLKDERRKKEKVAEGKTRLISASPMDYFILCRMYFGDFVRWLFQNRIRNSCAMGVNPYSHEWTELVHHMTSVGDNCIYGDYSGYDGSISLPLMYQFLKVCESFYKNSTEQERTIRKMLFMEVMNSHHVATTKDGKDSMIYEWYGSNPSGNFLTTSLNSICNIIAIKYSVVLCKAFEAGYTTYKRIPMEFIVTITPLFKNNLRITTFGDDNGISLGPELKDAVTQDNITKAMATLNLTYTDELKTGACFEHRSIKDCSFLKRGHKWNQKYKRYDAPLELEVILEAPYWTKTSAPKGSIETTINTSIMELSLHGEETFNKYAKIIARASIDKLNHHPNTNFKFNYNKCISMKEFY